MNIKLNIPGSWNDLSDLQLERIALLFGKDDRSVRLHIRIYFILLGLKWWQWIELRKSFLVLKEVAISVLRKYYDYIYTLPGPTRFLSPITLNGVCYYPPQDKIRNLSVEEFAIADDLFLKFHKTSDIEFLYYLAAVLYVPSPNGERPKFYKYNLDQMVIPFRKLKISKLLAIKLCYQGSRSVLTKRFKKAFPVHNKLSKKKATNGYGFSKVILGMSGGKFGEHEKTRGTNVYTFMEQFNSDLKNLKK